MSSRIGISSIASGRSVGTAAQFACRYRKNSGAPQVQQADHGDGWHSQNTPANHSRQELAGLGRVRGPRHQQAPTATSERGRGISLCTRLRPKPAQLEFPLRHGCETYREPAEHGQICMVTEGKEKNCDAEARQGNAETERQIRDILQLRVPTT